jgi:hypothetical protein
VGKNWSLWSVILEKAWAKIKGNYLNTDVGFVENSLRALTGVPIFRYKLAEYDEDADSLWDTLYSNHQSGYFLGTTTSGSNNQLLNPYGLSQGHSFAILSVFPLRNKFNEIAHKMYMLKNPWGKETYQGKWNHRDRKNWKDEYISQVPYGINPISSEKIDQDGIFFMDSETFVKSFYTFHVGHYK